MRLTWRDGLATVCVAAGVLLYALWLAGVAAGALTVGIVAGAILVLGVAASISAVVPGFAELLRASPVYLATTAVLGLVALASGVLSIVGASGTMLTTLAFVTVALWLLATARHLSVPHAPGLPRGRHA
jgi:Ca2+/Na+ antiporter